MFTSHKLATSIGAVGAAAVLGHVLLGPAIVPVAVAMSGAILLAGSVLYLFRVRRSSPDRD